MLDGGYQVSPRRSDAPGEPRAHKLPLSNMNMGSLKKNRDPSPFRGSPGRNAFRETAENGQRPLGETALPGRLCTNLKNPNGSNDRNSVGFEPVYPVFCVDGPKRAVLAVFRAPGGPNGVFTSCTSPRRSDALGELSAPKLPFSHIDIGSLKKKCGLGPFRGSPGRTAFRETAKTGQRPLGETVLPGRLCTNLKNPKGSNDQNSVGFEPVYPVFCVGGPKRALLALFWAPGGQGPIRKHQIGRHAKTAYENGSNPVRFLKSHVRREKGPTRGPGGPSVAGRGAHVSPRHSVSGAKTKKFEVPILPPEDLSVP